MQIRTPIVASFIGLIAASALPQAAPGRSPETVADLLAKCQACHGGDKPSGGVNLTTRQAALSTGALTPGRPEESRVFAAVTSKRMPPGNPLSSRDIESIRKWIADGARWPASTKPQRAGLDWWSLRPVRKPMVPAVRQKAWARSPIDNFVLAKMEARGLTPAPAADRATLLRRVTYDLTGLPPTPEDVVAFVADKSAIAYERVVDRLLASPRYGERWGRHWLDVARFGESHGYEYDNLRDHAWRYRDYVIEALNTDKPYDRFLREQIAGDAIPDMTPASVVATGFLVGGPMDEAGKAAAGVLVNLRAREEELEEMIGLVGQTCLGLTVNCARCHDHKFDPIPQRDYYRLKAALIGVNPGNRSALTPLLERGRAERAAQLSGQLAVTRAEIQQIEEPARKRIVDRKLGDGELVAVKPAYRWTFDHGASESVAGLGGALHGGAKISHGRLDLTAPGAYLQTDPLPKPVREKTLEAWVALPDLKNRSGSAITIETAGGGTFDAIVYGEREPRKWMAGSEFFRRTLDLAAPEEGHLPTEQIHIAIVYRADDTIQVFRDGRPYAPAYRAPGEEGRLRTYPAGKSHVLFGRRHTNSNGFLSGYLEEARLYDRALSPEEIAASHANSPFTISEPELVAAMEPEVRDLRARLLAGARQIEGQLREASVVPQTYGAISGKPAPVHILARGDVEAKGELVAAGPLSAIRYANGEFELAQDSSDHERRRKLADWIVAPQNPLTARVIVNRVWQYHFGRGIVATPNDFGFNGEKPTHPELLDWLSHTFVHDYRWSLKKLHRAILLSSTYRQSGKLDSRAAKLDSENRLLWRFTPRRLEAEAIRDSMLAVAGDLNLQMGGPSFRPFNVEKFGSNFYQLTDPSGKEFQRRTIYRMIVHSARSPLLEALDCPDPSTKTPKRTATTTPLQALELMNDSFVIRQSEGFAKRMEQANAETSVRSAYLTAYGRPPGPAELARAKQHLRKHTLASLCWAILNSSEFLYLR